MKQDPHAMLKRSLRKNYACHVLITCENPDDEGEMRVRMTFEGDQALASYLLEGAQFHMMEHEPLS